MLVKRTFTHKTFGSIGEVSLSIPAGTVMKMNDKELPIGSVEYLLTFALQSLQDAYAGAKTEDEAKGSWGKKRDAIIAGTVGVRVGGASVSDETRIGRRLIRDALKTKMGKDSEEWKTFIGLEDTAQNAKLDELYAKNKEKLAPKVQSELEALKAERERKAKLAKQTSDLDL